MTEHAPTPAATAPTDAQWSALGDADFVLLSTFRRSGVHVPTTVWVVRDSDALLVTTPPASGKVKRLRNDPRVQLTVCGRMGAVAPDAPTVDARAEIAGEDSAFPHAVEAFRAKYGAEFDAIIAMERRHAESRLAPDDTLADRLILRITRPGATG